MSDRRQRQQALLGGIIVRRAAGRILGTVDATMFDADIDRKVFVAAMNLAALGLDLDEDYICRVSQTVFFEDGQNAYLVGLVETFEREADERGDGSTLEDLARDVAAESGARRTGT